MNELDHFRQNALAPSHSADMAEALVARSGLRVEAGRRRGRGTGINLPGGLKRARGMLLMTVGNLLKIYLHSKPRSRLKKPARSSVRTVHRISHLTAPSMPTVAANTAVYIVSPVRHMPLWVCLRGWILKHGFSQNPTPPNCLNVNCPNRAINHGSSLWVQIRTPINQLRRNGVSPANCWKC